MKAAIARIIRAIDILAVEVDVTGEKKIRRELEVVR